MTTRSFSHNPLDFQDDSRFGADAGYQADVSAAATATATAVAAPLSDALYLIEAGDTSAISVNDIHQGQIGDCFLLASIGEEALFHPAAIANMIHDNGNGTETVTLNVDQNGGLPNFTSTSLKPLAVAVDNLFPAASVNEGATQGVIGSQKEIWPQVIEKAYAMINNGYSGISSGGFPVLAMEQLTGNVATFMSPASLTLAVLQSDAAAGDLMTFDTSANAGLPYGW